MSNVKCNVDDLAATIMQALTEYTDEVKEGVRKAEDEVAKECLDRIKADSPVNKGDYQKSWRKKVTKNTPEEYDTTIYNKEGRLTHLLEDGHAKVGKKGGRTRAFPHIKKNEQWANAELEKRVKELIENAGH